MKKKIVCLLAMTLAAVAVTGCGTQKDAGKTFTVGFDAEYPPYGYMDDNGEKRTLNIAGVENLFSTIKEKLFIREI